MLGSLGGRTILALLLALGLAWGLAGCANMTQGGADREAQRQDSTTAEPGSPARDCPPGAPTDSIVADPATVNDEKLVDFADNVFVGRVVEKVGYVPPDRGVPPLPQTEFAVEVQRNIKGSFSGTVVVVQKGGCDPRYGRVVIVNDDELLRPGEEAVFSTKKQGPGGPNLIVGSNYGDIRVRTETREAEVVSSLRNTRPEAVPFAP